MYPTGKVSAIQETQMTTIQDANGNFGDVLAGFFAKKLGVPSESLVVATNENDILHRFWQTGAYEKNPVHGPAAEGGFVEDGAKVFFSSDPMLE
ncbi:MAG: hypothetical protein LQ346_002455 [Caloplaca aetnensis]|nr:MAG: hypothetical protein LQ346_002455 [Caloplaca aetnensis]